MRLQAQRRVHDGEETLAAGVNDAWSAATPMHSTKVASVASKHTRSGRTPRMHAGTATAGPPRMVDARRRAPLPPRWLGRERGPRGTVVWWHGCRVARLSGPCGGGGTAAAMAGGTRRVRGWMRHKALSEGRRQALLPSTGPCPGGSKDGTAGGERRRER